MSLANFHFGMEGEFTLQRGKYDIDGNDVKLNNPITFSNLILDTGLNRIGHNNDYMNYLHLGSGIQQPHVLQASLQNKTYSGSAKSPTNTWDSGINVSDLTKPFIWFKRSFRVPPQTINQTYAELGVGWNATELFSRTLIKDPSGSPTTITIIGDEYLDVTYELRIYIPTSTSITHIVPTGSDTIEREVTARACNASTHTSGTGWSLNHGVDSPISINHLHSSNLSYFTNGVIQGMYSSPLGDKIDYFNFTVESKPSQTESIIKIVRLLPQSVGTLRSLVLCSSMFAFQIQFNPPFIKTNEDKFDLEFSVTWGRTNVT